MISDNYDINYALFIEYFKRINSLFVQLLRRFNTENPHKKFYLCGFSDNFQKKDSLLV